MSENNTPKRVWVLFSGHVQGVCFRDGIEAKAHEESIYGGVQNLKRRNERVWAIFEKSHGEDVEKMLSWCEKAKVSRWSKVKKVEVIHKPRPKRDSKSFKRWIGKPNNGKLIRLRAILLPADQGTDEIQEEADNLDIAAEIRSLDGERNWLGAVFQGPFDAVNKMREWCLKKAADFEEIEDDILGDDSNFELQD